jgi:hypothetical protein
VGRIDRRACRDTFERRYTSHVMAGQYLENYRVLAEERMAA